jgi:hypothetical protein
MAALLGDQAQRAATSGVVNLATGLGVDGIDLDYESMNFGGARRTRRRFATGFVALVGELGAALNTQDMTLSVTVGPRTTGRTRTGRCSTTPASPRPPTWSGS